MEGHSYSVFRHLDMDRGGERPRFDNVLNSPCLSGLGLKVEKRTFWGETFKYNISSFYSSGGEKERGGAV